MAVPVRINEDNYVSLKQLAEKERRSVVAQLDVILDEYFKRDTVGIMVASEADLDGTPIKNTHLPEKPQVGNLPKPQEAEYHPAPKADVSYLLNTPEKNASEANASGVSRDEVIEQTCCLNETRPCKHWVWDTATGEGYRNTLSGRFKEIEG